MCTVILPLGDNPIAVYKYIISLKTTAHTGTSHWYLPHTGLIQATPQHPIPFRSILISYLCPLGVNPIAVYKYIISLKTTAHTGTSHWFLPHTGLIQATPQHPIPFRSILISHLCPGLQKLHLISSHQISSFLCMALPYPAHSPSLCHPDYDKTGSTQHAAPHYATDFSLLLPSSS